MHTFKKIILFFLIIHLFGSVLYIVKSGNTIKFWDEEDYYTISSNIIEKGKFSRYGEVNNACRPPGYPFFLAAVMMLSKKVIFIKFIQLCLYYLSAYLIYKITYIIRQNKTISLLSVFLFLIYPSILYITNTLYPQILYMILFLLLLYILLLRSRQLYAYILLGVINASLIYIIPIHILFLPFIIFFIWKENQESRLLKSGILILVTIAVLLPWTWRNYNIFNRFVVIATNGGQNLLCGNSPNTTPNSGTTTDISEFIEEDVIQQLDDAELDKYYRDKALTFIQQKPLYYLGLYFRKFLNYFNYQNVLNTKEQSTEINPATKLKFIVIAITWFPVLFLSIFGFIIKEIRKNFDNIYVMLLFICSGLFYSIFFTRIRFRSPFVPLLLIIASQTVFYLYNKIKNSFYILQKKQD